MSPEFRFHHWSFFSTGRGPGAPTVAFGVHLREKENIPMAGEKKGSKNLRETIQNLAETPRSLLDTFRGITQSFVDVGLESERSYKGTTVFLPTHRNSSKTQEGRYPKVT